MLHFERGYEAGADLGCVGPLKSMDKQSKPLQVGGGLEGGPVSPPGNFLNRVPLDSLLRPM